MQRMNRASPIVKYEGQSGIEVQELVELLATEIVGPWIHSNLNSNGHLS
jgi:hypothetical protein